MKLIRRAVLSFSFVLSFPFLAQSKPKKIEIDNSAWVECRDPMSSKRGGVGGMLFPLNAQSTTEVIVFSNFKPYVMTFQRPKPNSIERGQRYVTFEIYLENDTGNKVIHKGILRSGATPTLVIGNGTPVPQLVKSETQQKFDIACSFNLSNPRNIINNSLKKIEAGAVIPKSENLYKHPLWTIPDPTDSQKKLEEIVPGIKLKKGSDDPNHYLNEDVK